MKLIVSIQLGADSVATIFDCDYTPGDPPSRDSDIDGGESSPGNIVELDNGEVTTWNVFVLDYAANTGQDLFKAEQQLLDRVHAECEEYIANRICDDHRLY